jgi:hypothetical protein
MNDEPPFRDRTRLPNTSPKEGAAMTTTESGQVRDEAQLRQRIADQLSAVCAKDLDRLMDPFAADVAEFDVKPSFRTDGVAA